MFFLGDHYMVSEVGWNNFNNQRHLYYTETSPRTGGDGTTLHDVHDSHGQDRDLTKSLIRDCLVCGIVNNRTRSHLLKKADLTLSPRYMPC